MVILSQVVHIKNSQEGMPPSLLFFFAFSIIRPLCPGNILVAGQTCLVPFENTVGLDSFCWVQYVRACEYLLAIRVCPLILLSVKLAEHLNASLKEINSAKKIVI